MHDYFICPNDQILSYRNIRKNGNKEYRCDKGICQSCPLAKTCLSPTQPTKLITRHLWEDHYD